MLSISMVLALSVLNELFTAVSFLAVVTLLVLNSLEHSQAPLLLMGNLHGCVVCLKGLWNSMLIIWSAYFVISCK